MVRYRNLGDEPMKGLLLNPSHDTPGTSQKLVVSIILPATLVLLSLGCEQLTLNILTCYLIDTVVIQLGSQKCGIVSDKCGIDIQKRCIGS